MGYHVESLYKVSDFTKITLKEKILENIVKKKSNICVSLDFTRFEDIIGSIEILKEKIVMIKIHCDIIQNFSDEFVEKNG